MFHVLTLLWQDLFPNKVQDEEDCPLEQEEDGAMVMRQMENVKKATMTSQGWREHIFPYE